MAGVPFAAPEASCLTDPTKTESAVDLLHFHLLNGSNEPAGLSAAADLSAAAGLSVTAGLSAAAGLSATADLTWRFLTPTAPNIHLFANAPVVDWDATPLAAKSVVSDHESVVVE